MPPGWADSYEQFKANATAAAAAAAVAVAAVAPVLHATRKIYLNLKAFAFN